MALTAAKYQALASIVQRAPMTHAEAVAIEAIMGEVYGDVVKAEQRAEKKAEKAQRASVPVPPAVDSNPVEAAQ